MHDDDRGFDALVCELRTEVPPRRGWRRSLQARLDAEAAHLGRRGAPADQLASRDSRRTFLTLHPVVAVAASLALLALGGIGGAVWSSRPVAEATPLTMAGTIERAAHDVGVRFAVVAPGVHRVSLVGDFNGWDPAATPLQRERDQQTWSILLPLAQGRHAYAFVIDGAVVADPTAPSVIDEDFGTPSSMVLVSREIR